MHLVCWGSGRRAKRFVMCSGGEQIANLCRDEPYFIVGSTTSEQGARNLHYTPGQLRDTVGLSKEAFRHWKRVVPAFANGRGHAPSFSTGDVLASAVLRRLTDTAGVRIGHLSEITPAIFRVCNEASWEVLRQKNLIIDLHERSCVVVDDPALPTGELVVVCALAPLIKALQFDLLNSTVSSHPKPRVSNSNGEHVRKRGGR